MAQSLEVKHNIEMGHRLAPQVLGGKCQHLHGHSWWCHLEIVDLQGAPEDGRGNIILDLADVKRRFRSHLDNSYDHRFAMDANDILLERFPTVEAIEEYYPGIVLTPGPPTVENMARWIGEHLRQQFGTKFGYRVKLFEAATNAATWEG